MAILNKKRTPVSPALRAKLAPTTPTGRYWDRSVIFFFRPLKRPYWTREGLVAYECHSLPGDRARKSQKRISEPFGDGFAPALMTGAAIETLRAQEPVK